MLAGIVNLFVFLQMLWPSGGPIYQLLPQTEELGILGALNLLSFGLSLTGGVLTLDRNHVIWVFRAFIVAIVGPIVPFGVSFATPQTSFGINQILFFFIFFSLPAICLDAVALIFIALRREDFPKS